MPRYAREALDIENPLSGDAAPLADRLRRNANLPAQRAGAADNAYRFFEGSIAVRHESDKSTTSMLGASETFMDARAEAADKLAMASLGTTLMKAREAKGLARAYVASRLKVSVSAVGQWERGDHEPSTENLQRLSALYGIDAGAALVGILKAAPILHDGPYPDPDEQSSEDIAADQHPIDPDAPPTIGSETGRRGVPRDATAQLDVTAGMGGGGLTIISPGVPGQSGMTFAAEHVRDYWRLPPHMLAGMGLRPHDIVIIPVQGDSMLPTLNEGDCVFVDTRHRLPSPDGIYALTDEFGGIVVKRLEVLGRRDDEVMVHVISDNERHPARERMLSEIQIIGRVVRRFGVIG